MNLTKGQVVEVTDYQGKKHRKVVVKDLGERVAITSAEILKEIERGETDIPPIAVPRETVRPLV